MYVLKALKFLIKTESDSVSKIAGIPASRISSTGGIGPGCWEYQSIYLRIVWDHPFIQVM